MTYSIIARCPRTGSIGQAIATFAIATGGRLDGFNSSVGICKTMAIPVRDNDVLAIRLMALGHKPETVLKMIESNDPGYANRQIAMMDLSGRVAVHTGEARPWCGHRQGDGVVAAGNMLAGPQVVDALISSFMETAKAPLADRLIFALQSAQAAGGQRGPDGRIVHVRSAALRVMRPGAHLVDVDLRIDYHEQSVAELLVLFQKMHKTNS